VYAVSSWKDNTNNLSQEIIRATLNENVTDSFMRLYTITDNDMLEHRSESFPLAVDVLTKTSEIWLIEQSKTANIELIIQALEKEPEETHRALLFTMSHPA
jgi:NAD-dependent DNA ligase